MSFNILSYVTDGILSTPVSGIGLPVIGIAIPSQGTVLGGIRTRIYGGYFGSFGGVVLVGGTLATVLEWSDNEILISTPIGTVGSADITVITADTLSYTLNDGFVFTNGANESVRNRIRDALIYQLKQITINNGYRNNIVEVHDVLPSMEKLRNFPAVVVVLGDENIVNYDVQSSTFKTMQKDLQIFLHIFLQEHNDVGQAQDRIIADIEKMIGIHFGLEGEDGQCTTFLSQIVSSRPFGLTVNKPNCGVTINLRARYQQLRKDPTVKT